MCLFQKWMGIPRMLHLGVRVGPPLGEDWVEVGAEPPPPPRRDLGERGAVGDRLEGEGEGKASDGEGEGARLRRGTLGDRV